MAAAVVSHLVKVEPENEAWWINLAYPFSRTESVEKAEAILLGAQAIHPNVAISFPSPAMRASRAAWWRRKSTLCIYGG